MTMHNPHEKPPLARVAAVGKDKNYLDDFKGNFVLRKDICELNYSIKELNEAVKILLLRRSYDCLL
jgi:hypothetical protein